MTRLLRFYEFVPNSDRKRRRSFPMVLAKQACINIRTQHGFSVVLYPRSKNRTHSDLKIPYSDLKIELTHRFARNNAFDHHEFQYWWSAFCLQLVVPSFLDQNSTLMPNPASELGWDHKLRPVPAIFDKLTQNLLCTIWVSSLTTTSMIFLIAIQLQLY